jgi:predicted DNA-binding transcriptional regulator AlpA
MKQELLSATETAAALGCSRASIWRYTKAGTIPKPVKLGHLTRWRRADIESFIKSVAIAA